MNLEEQWGEVERGIKRKRRRERFGFVLVVSAISTVVVVGGLLAERLLQSDAATTAQTETRTLAAINVVRLNRGLPKLKLSEALRDISRVHSRDMQRRGYFAHERARGGFVDRLAGITPDGARIGEVLAWGTGGFSTADGFISLWLSSPGHKRILLTKSFRRFGCGIVKGKFFGQANASIITCDFST